MNTRHITEKLAGLSVKPTKSGVSINWKGKTYHLIYMSGKLWLPVKEKPKDLRGFDWYFDWKGVRKYVGTDVDEGRVKELLTEFGNLYVEYVLETTVPHTPEGLRRALRTAKIHTALMFLVRLFLFIFTFLFILLMYLSRPESSSLNLLYIYFLMLVILGIDLFIKTLREIKNLRRVRFELDKVYIDDTPLPKDADIEVYHIKWRSGKVRISYNDIDLELPPAYAIPLAVAGYKVKENILVGRYVLTRVHGLEDILRMDIIAGTIILTFAGLFSGLILLILLRRS